MPKQRLKKLCHVSTVYTEEFNALNKHATPYDPAIHKGIERYINSIRS